MEPIVINGREYGTTDDLRAFMHLSVDKISDINLLYYARELGVMEEYKAKIIADKQANTPSVKKYTPEEISEVIHSDEFREAFLDNMDGSFDTIIELLEEFFT